MYQAIARRLGHWWTRATAVTLLSLIAVGSAFGQASVYYIHTDALGSPVVTTDAAGAIVETSAYEPYGLRGGIGAIDEPGFAGHVGDSASGLTYMQQRYYDPQVGRFLSADPVAALSGPVGMFNRYRYAANNPYRFVDPDGRCDTSFCQFWGGVGRAVGDGVFSIAGNAGPTVYGTFDMSGYRVQERGPMFGVPNTPVGRGGYKFGSALVVAEGLRMPARVAGGVVKLPPQTKTVGRWMSPIELRKMRETGRVQEGGGGQTRVSDPPSPESYRAAPEGDVYVEFDVPASRVLPHSNGTGRIPGPNSPDARVPGRNPNDYVMPKIDGVREVN